ncbi:MAG TPA: hypothetical protein VJ256_05700, partial [Dehalococcoidia bacterium]|nr:hypothetical protein [Dehalococcoidia bacterium]
MGQLWKSAEEYISAFGYWGLLMIAPLGLDIFSVYQVAAQEPTLPGPIWAYVAAGYILTFAIPFLAFHKRRMEATEAGDERTKTLLRLISRFAQRASRVVFSAHSIP